HPALCGASATERAMTKAIKPVVVKTREHKAQPHKEKDSREANGPKLHLAHKAKARQEEPDQQQCGDRCHHHITPSGESRFLFLCRHGAVIPESAVNARYDGRDVYAAAATRRADFPHDGGDQPLTMRGAGSMDGPC